MYGIGPAVHQELVLLVEIGVLPDRVGAAVVDQVGELVLLLLLARRLQAAPLRRHELGLAVLAELAVGVEALGADDLAVLERGGRLLEAVGAHGAQALVGDELPALLVGVVAVHERVLLGLPVEALELVGVGGVAHGAERRLQVVGDPGGDQAVGHGLARRVHVALGQAHPALAVHRGQVHLARGRRRQPDVAGLADLASARCRRRPRTGRPARIAPMIASTMAARSPAGTVLIASFTRSVRFL